MILQAVPAAEQKLLQSERVDFAPLFSPGGGGGAFTPLLPALRKRSQNRAQPRQTCEHHLPLYVPVADPDPQDTYVFWPPGPVSQSFRSVSG